MPNWCLQTLVVSGEKDDLAPFANKLLASRHNGNDNHNEGNYEFLMTFYPTPDDLYRGPFEWGDLEAYVFKDHHKDEDHGEYISAWTKEQLQQAKKKYGETGWIDICWMGQNWGSPGPDFATTIREHDDTHLTIMFLTKYSPVLEGILHISNDYPLLTFSVDFVEDQDPYHLGRVEIKGGEVLSQREDTEDFNESFDESKYNPAGSISSNIEDNFDVF